jgi:very-short-patch-repair endonuclease
VVSWEETLLIQMRAVGLPEPKREHMGIPGRRFRYDFWWEPEKLAVEVEGGVYLGRFGRHTSPQGYTKDAEKYNLGALQGHTIIRVTPSHIRTGHAIRWICEAHELRNSDGEA